MYKVLLVDDEPTNYQLFEKLVPWGQKGFEIAGTAGDGLEALQKYDEIHPDLIFMDIQLPLLDGLDCIRHIREENGKVRIVIVSAYGDFSYAQKAIQYGVQDFLLKPVSRLMLNQLVDKMKASLDNEGTSSGSADMEKQYMRYLESLLHRGADTQEAERCLQDKRLCGLLLTDVQGQTVTDARRELLLEELQKTNWSGAKLLLKYCPVPGYTVLLWEGEASENEFVENLQTELESEGYHSYLYLYDRDKDASPGEWLRQFSAVQNYGFYENRSGVYRLTEFPFKEIGLWPDRLDQTVARAVAEGSAEPLTELLETVFQSAADGKVNPQLLKETILDCMVRIKFVLKKFDPQDSFLMMRNVRVDSIFQIQNADYLKAFTQKKVQDTFAEIGANCRIPGKNLVFRANAFTEVSYQDASFSVQKVADYIGISKNYFTSQYKEGAGTGFWEYVTQLRMEKAKELLITTDEMVGTIARLVGYESEFHFSRKFKEYTGQSPQTFRKSVEKSKKQEK